MIGVHTDADFDPFVVDGVQFRAGDEPGTLFYIPAVPVPQRGELGRPAVTVVRTPKAVMLQLGAQFALADSDLMGLAAPSTK